MAQWLSVYPPIAVVNTDPIMNYGSGTVTGARPWSQLRTWLDGNLRKQTFSSRSYGSRRRLSTYIMAARDAGSNRVEYLDLQIDHHHDHHHDH
jgi:hypothetical protein